MLWLHAAHSSAGRDVDASSACQHGKHTKDQCEGRHADDDGIVDSLDICPNTPAGESVDSEGCSLSQKDTDGDGVTDDIDACPETPAGATVDATGCEIPLIIDNETNNSYPAA